MSFTIQQSNKTTWAQAPILLIFAILWLYPLADAGDPRYSAYFRFGVAACVLFSSALWEVNKWVAMFFLLAGFSSIFPISSRFSSEAFRAVFIGCIWFYMVAQTPRGKINYLLDAICILALCNIVMLISQYFGFDPIFKPKDGGHIPPAVGFLSNRNEASAFLAFCLPAFFRERWKCFTPLVFIGLTITSSTGGALAAVLSVWAYFFLKDGRGALLKNCFLLCAVTIWFSFFLGVIDFPAEVFETKQITQMAEDGKTVIAITAPPYSRLEAWRKGYELYKQHWIFGSGLGHWKIVFMQINLQGKWFKWAHNEFIQTLFELGILFTIVCAGYLFSVFGKVWCALSMKNRELILPTVAIIAICLNSLINFPFHIAQTAILAITWMAIFEVQNKKARLIGSVQ